MLKLDEKLVAAAISDEELQFAEPETPQKHENRVDPFAAAAAAAFSESKQAPRPVIHTRPEGDIVIKGLLDPASNSNACPNIPAEKLYTVREDGLDLMNEWDGYVFLNPPFDGNVQWRFINSAWPNLHICIVLKDEFYI